MSVRFWGVRGSTPCPGPQTARYGGNTPCVEVRCGSHVLIFDAGTGIRSLGCSLVREAAAGDFDLFLSHTHLDHIIGLPFFAPLHLPDQIIRIWAGHLMTGWRIENVVGKMMNYPFFPIQIETLQASLKFHDFHAGDVLTPRPGVTMRTAPLDHPDGATGYRIEYAGRSMAYLTDTELGDGPIGPALLSLADRASLLILDTTYTDEEYPAHVGWGHSTWRQGMRLANAANVETLCLFHHNPAHDDTAMDAIAAAAESERSGTIVAREGLSIDL
jgi:phosphoribosyl 1,2-cyclic phosphodiesterase